MLNIYICEDQIRQLESLKKTIENYLFKKTELDMKIVCATQDPVHLLKAVQKSENMGVYFLDIDLKSHMNGINLAYEIRQYDPRGFIVFLTAYAEHMPTIFQYRLEVMDYILKSSSATVKARIQDCILDAWNRYKIQQSQQKQSIQVKQNNTTFYLDADKIIYIEAIKATHKISIYTTESVHECYMTLKEITEVIPDTFVRCHNSFIVNKNHILKVDRSRRIVYLTNDYSCEASQRMLKNL